MTFRSLLLVVALNVSTASGIDFVRDKDGFPILPDWCAQAISQKQREKKSALSSNEAARIPVEQVDAALSHGRAWRTRNRDVFAYAETALVRSSNVIPLHMLLEESWRDIEVTHLLENVLHELAPEEDIDYLDPVAQVARVVGERDVLFVVDMSDEYAEVQLEPLAGALDHLLKEIPNAKFLIFTASENLVTEILLEADLQELPGNPS